MGIENNIAELKSVQSITFSAKGDSQSQTLKIIGTDAELILMLLHSVIKKSGTLKTQLMIDGLIEGIRSE